ncbi:ATP-dependent DNA helicase [Elysia marginata]|uniref:ATP-dependent DNA helicase n=1 Tax=Elysia marginata TaxID=1093978 RepID=A0AAV4ESU7_9GAST|nr:ATP-dependent DNA helicase [Elysia marginata]
MENAIPYYRAHLIAEVQADCQGTVRDKIVARQPVAVRYGPHSVQDKNVAVQPVAVRYGTKSVQGRGIDCRSAVGYTFCAGSQGNLSQCGTVPNLCRVAGQPVALLYWQSGGGICVIHRESLDMQCTALTTMTHFECCQCKLFINGRSLLLICIYRPRPSSTNKFTPKQFLAEFETFLGGFSLNVHLPIIIGDFNLHYDNQTETYVCQIRDILRTHLLSQVVNTPTQKKTQHILDCVVTPDIDLINNLQVMDKCISDHKVIVFELPYSKPKLVKRTITCRKKNIDNQALSYLHSAYSGGYEKRLQ